MGKNIEIFLSSAHANGLCTNIGVALFGQL
jgi:hypothetical protein